MKNIALCRGLLTLFTVFSLTGTVFASDNFEYIQGGLTWHTSGIGAEKYSNQLSPDGRLIYTQLQGLRYVSEAKDGYYFAAEAFIGQNSIASPMEGTAASYGLYGKYWAAGVLVGAYVENKDDYSTRTLGAFCATTVGSSCYVPLLGPELSLKQPLGRVYLKENLILTPVIFNANISLGVQF